MTNIDLDMENRARTQKLSEDEEAQRATSAAAAGCDANTIGAMIRAMTIPRNVTLKEALYAAHGRTLFLWWHAALSHELTEEEPADKRLAKALAAMIAAECARRCGPPR